MREWLRSFSLSKFSFFVEAELLDCINCDPVPHGTRNHPGEASERSASLQTDSGGFQVGSGDRGQQCLSEAAAPRIFQSGRTCVETSGDVIESTITSTAECRMPYMGL